MKVNLLSRCKALLLFAILLNFGDTVNGISIILNSCRMLMLLRCNSFCVGENEEKLVWSSSNFVC